MKCLVCKNVMKSVHGGDVEFRRQGELVVVKNIDFFECEVCGERVCSSSTTDIILRKLFKEDSKEYIKVPVYS